MAQQFQEQILFQHRTSTTNNEFMWQCPEHYTAKVVSIVVANVTGNAITYRLFVNPSGTSLAIGNALTYDTALAANIAVVWTRTELDGVPHPTSFGIRSSTAEAVVVTCFGILMKTG